MAGLPAGGGREGGGGVSRRGLQSCPGQKHNRETKPPRFGKAQSMRRLVFQSAAFFQRFRINYFSGRTLPVKCGRFFLRSHATMLTARPMLELPSVRL